jgi:hypothetical protein
MAKAQLPQLRLIFVKSYISVFLYMEYQQLFSAKTLLCESAYSHMDIIFDLGLIYGRTPYIVGS